MAGAAASQKGLCSKCRVEQLRELIGAKDNAPERAGKKYEVHYRQGALRGIVWSAAEANAFRDSPFCQNASCHSNCPGHPLTRFGIQIAWSFGFQGLMTPDGETTPMHILITGATGFLGTTLCRRLRAAGHDIIPLGSRDCDLTSDQSLSRFDGQRFDQIWHLAAWTQAGDFCLHHPGEQWIRNQQINTNVLAWWAAKQRDAKLICMGTSCAYAPDRELVEQNYLDGRPIDSLFTYAMTKRMLFVGLQALSKQLGMKWLCLVPSTLYGPGYHTDGRQMHFIFDLIRKILRGKFNGEPVVLWGDGHQAREVVFVDDFVAAATRLAHSTTNELVNIGAGEEFTIRQFARWICDEVDFDFDRIQFDTSRYVGARSKCLSVAKLNRLLPEFSRTPLPDGLALTIRWFLEHREILLSKAA